MSAYSSPRQMSAEGKRITHLLNKRRFIYLALIGFVYIGVAIFGGQLRAQVSGGTHTEREVHRLELNHGTKWATDLPLRTGMNEIRSLVLSNTQKLREGDLTQEDYATLGTRIEAQVAYIVTNCKLEPRADANLHVVIAQLVAGADILQGKKRNTPPREGTALILDALNAYGAYFDHPGWKLL